MAEFLHPSVSSKIIDNSYVFVAASGVTKLFQAFTSDIGLDNVMQEMTSTSEYIFHYGEPNYRAHGQVSLNILNWIKSEGTVVCLRVLPDDATYANTFLTLMTREVQDLNGVVTDIEVQTIQETFTGLTTKGAIEAKLKENVALDVDGWATNRLFCITPKGRGAADYNKLGFNIALNDALDDTFPAFRSYSFQILKENKSGGIDFLDSAYNVALDPLAFNDLSQESMSLEYIVQKYSPYFDVYFNDSAFEDLGLIFNQVQTAEVSPGIFDYLTLVNRDTEIPEVLYANIALSTNFGTFSTNDNFVCKSGSVGSMVAEKEALLVKAYTGLIDDGLLNKKLWLIDMVMDSNVSTPVKDAMAQLSRDIRKDFICILHTGYTATPQQDIDVRKNTLGYNSFFVSIFTQDMYVYDAYTGGNVKVDSTYFLSGKIPRNDVEFGLHWNFVGPRRGTIAGFDLRTLSWAPNEIWKENLYKAQVNYIEVDPNNTSFATQLTSQKANSALSNTSIARTILRIQREVEALVDSYRMEWSDTQTLKDIQYNLDAYVVKWVNNRACEYVKPVIYQSEYDKLSKLARVRIDIKFTLFIERFLIDLVVNR